MMFTISDGQQRASITYSVKSLKDNRGAVGLLQSSGDSPQLFGNFVVKDGYGNTLFKDNFEGVTGTIPPGWKYIVGGPNAIEHQIVTELDGIGWHPGPNNSAYFSSVREFQKQCREMGFRGEFFATEIYAGSMYPPGPPETLSELRMAKFLVKSLVGHNGLGMEAGPCNIECSAWAYAQGLCQPTWGVQTLIPLRPTIAYYVWRTIGTVMDDFHAAEFPVKFGEGEGLVFFTFQRGANERMVAVWIDGPEKDGIVQTKTAVAFPDVQAKRASVVDILNGREQSLNFAHRSAETVLEGMLIKDYPVFIKITE